MGELEGFQVCRFPKFLKCTSWQSFSGIGYRYVQVILSYELVEMLHTETLNDMEVESCCYAVPRYANVHCDAIPCYANVHCDAIPC